jgi:hypothetical protein
LRNAVLAWVQLILSEDQSEVTVPTDGQLFLHQDKKW